MLILSPYKLHISIKKNFPRILLSSFVPQFYFFFRCRSFIIPFFYTISLSHFFCFLPSSSSFPSVLLVPTRPFPVIVCPALLLIVYWPPCMLSFLFFCQAQIIRLLCVCCCTFPSSVLFVVNPFHSVNQPTNKFSHERHYSRRDGLVPWRRPIMAESGIGIIEGIIILGQEMTSCSSWNKKNCCCSCLSNGNGWKWKWEEAEIGNSWCHLTTNDGWQR